MTDMFKSVLHDPTIAPPDNILFGDLMIDMAAPIFTDPPNPDLIGNVMDATTGLTDPPNPDQTIKTWLAAASASDPTSDLMNGDGGGGNDPPDFATLSIGVSNAVRNEGNGPNSPFTFIVSRAGDSSTSVSAHWNVSGQGASPATAADFVGGVLPSGTVSFAAGQTSKIITVSVKGDTTFENDEGFFVKLSSPSAGAVLGKTTALGTIVDDDRPMLSVTALNATRFEGDNNSNTPFTFDVTRTGDTSLAVSTDWLVEPDVPNYGLDQFDFAGVGLPTGVVSFAPGETHKTITINVRGDDIAEGDENFYVSLWNNSPNAAVDGGLAMGTILTDDHYSYAYIEPANAYVAEGNSGTTPYTFTLARAPGTASDVAVNVDWSVPALPGAGLTAADFAGGALPSGTASLGVGQMSTTITVYAAGDTMAENDEKFSVVLSNPSNGLFLNNTAAVGEIINDDGTTLMDPAPPSASRAGESDSTMVSPATLSAGLINPSPLFIGTTVDGGSSGAMNQMWDVRAAGNGMGPFADLFDGAGTPLPDTMGATMEGANADDRMPPINAMTWNDGGVPLTPPMMLPQLSG